MNTFANGLPVWHVSISLQRNCKGPKHTKAWSARETAWAFNLAQDLLKGVGDGKNFTQVGEYAIHLRRAVSEGEIAQLSQDFLNCQAIDKP